MRAASVEPDRSSRASCSSWESTVVLSRVRDMPRLCHVPVLSQRGYRLFGDVSMSLSDGVQSRGTRRATGLPAMVDAYTVHRDFRPNSLTGQDNP